MFFARIFCFDCGQLIASESYPLLAVCLPYPFLSRCSCRASTRFTGGTIARRSVLPLVSLPSEAIEQALSGALCRRRYRWPRRSFSDGWSSSLSLPSFFGLVRRRGTALQPAHARGSVPTRLCFIDGLFVHVF